MVYCHLPAVNPFKCCFYKQVCEITTIDKSIDRPAQAHDCIDFCSFSIPRNRMRPAENCEKNIKFRRSNTVPSAACCGQFHCSPLSLQTSLGRLLIRPFAHQNLSIERRYRKTLPHSVYNRRSSDRPRRNPKRPRHEATRGLTFNKFAAAGMPTTIGRSV